MPSTDVAAAPAVDPGGKSDQWDSVLSDAISSTGIDPSAPLPDAEEPASQTPPVAERSSAPSAPEPAATGDSGTGQPQASTSQPAAPADASESEEPIPDASPFTYMVDGQPRTIEGAYVLPGEGLFVPEARVPQFQQLAMRADVLDRQNRELTARTESFEKAVEWNDGTKVLKGAQAVEAQRVYIERLQAAVKGFASVLTPQNFAKYVAIGQNPDGTYYVSPDEAAIKELQERTAFEARVAEFNARQAFAPIAQSFSAGQPTTAQPVADAPIESMAPATVDQLASAMKLTLSPDSKTFLVSQLPRYVRATTPEERPQYGPRIVDESFKQLVEREAKAQQSVATATTAATTAAKFNGGMQRGRTPAPAPARSQNPAPAKPPEKRGKADAWDNVFKEAMADIQV